ncbi:ComEC/Rec2 family competence protein [Celeribacter indicus]|uniref:ComEC/Rec2-like protein n=1 Tax=Celeribacter indicus TaxID=1208324 RepID=A0A0B5E1G1_9RHOB|nr:ComEC/Rec2 family competence protein [Celeribacter indicus]AJE46302.1 ComEC/Rec2-like protein [Celeribacter indicus]SDW52742.1 competence protein ComEC [Celeribacter indicus]
MTRLHPLRRAAGGLPDLVEAQRGRLVLWLPVCFGGGVGLFFALPHDPARATLALLAVALAAALLLLRRMPPRLAPLLVGTLAFGLGCLAAGLRTHAVAAPVLGFRYHGPVEGRVVAIDRSASDALRLTLDRVRLRDVAPDRTPLRVRVSLHGAQGFVTPEPGARLGLTAHLSPPPGPAEPGGFDFRRSAWFDRLGAVGYTRVPVLRLGETDRGAALWIHRQRQALSAALQTRLPGQTGAFAAAILTGDRSGIGEETAESLRAANLSHLLAISGLHMGLLTGAVFFALRLALALVPGAALKWPLKKLAAAGAMAAGLFYLALSGWNVATERAFVMVCVMLGAILIDRQAISLRAVALAALLILAFRPEVLPEPGFQMSFAATTALVAVFTLLRRGSPMARWPKPLRGVAAVVLSSAVAGLATAPVAAAHFNRIADFGLIANLAAVPVMGALIMPAAVVALVLAPFGLSGAALWAMGLGIRWVLFVAATVSGWEGAVSRVPAPPPETLPLLALGGLFVLLWRGRVRLLGLAPVVAGVLAWSLAERPALLVSGDGGLVGRMGAEGRALSKATGSGFAAEVWLENDGDLPDQAMAAARPMPPLDIGGLRIAHVTGRGWQARAAAACAAQDLVIVNRLWEGPPPPGGCLLADLGFLRASGALAVGETRGGVRLRTAQAAAGTRLWTAPALRGPGAPSAAAAQAALPQGASGLLFDPAAGARLAGH